MAVGDQRCHPQAAGEHHQARTGDGRIVPLSAITATAVREGVDRRAGTPFQAKNFVQTMRGLFEWLKDSGIVAANPCDGIKVKKPKTRGFLEWTYEEILQYEQRWPIGTRERVMLDVFA